MTHMPLLWTTLLSFRPPCCGFALCELCYLSLPRTGWQPYAYLLAAHLLLYDKHPISVCICPALFRHSLSWTQT